MNNRILITGGAGFIGSSIFRKAGQAHDCLALDNFTPNYDIGMKLHNVGLNEIPPYGVCKNNVINADMLDMDTVNRILSDFEPGIIIHAAALPGIRSSMDYPYKYFKENISSTLNLAESARINGIKHIIFLSSSSVYGDNGVPFKENMEPRPQSVYAQSKHSCEDMLRMYSMTYSMNIIVLRMFTVYGPGQRPDLAIHKFFLNAHEKKQSEIYGSTETYRDYTYIRDAVNGIYRAYELKEELGPFEIFNIGSQRKIYMRELISRIRHYFPDFSYTVTPEREGDLIETLSDTSKAEKVLAYENETEFSEGLDLFYEWFKEYYNA